MRQAEVCRLASLHHTCLAAAHQTTQRHKCWLLTSLSPLRLLQVTLLGCIPQLLLLARKHPQRAQQSVQNTFGNIKYCNREFFLANLTNKIYLILMSMLVFSAQLLINKTIIIIITWHCNLYMTMQYYYLCLKVFSHAIENTCTCTVHDIVLHIHEK